MGNQRNNKNVFKSRYTELVLEYIKNYDRFLTKVAYEVKLKCPKEDIDDIKQHIIYTIFRKRENIKEDLQYLKNTYFSQIALNTAKNYIKTYWQQKNKIYAECVSLDCVIDNEKNLNEEKYINLISEDDESYFNPDVYYLKHQALDKIKMVVATLSPIEKKVFYMFLDGNNIAMIAKKLRKSKKTIYNVLASIKDKSKTQLDYYE